MAEHVVGDWKGFTFSLAGIEDSAEVGQHVRDYFLRGEVMNEYLGWCEENAKDHDRMVRLALSHGISFLVRDKETRELAAIQLNIDKRQAQFDSLFTETAPSPTLSKIYSFLTRMEGSTDEAFQKQFPCEFYAEIFCSSVATKYRGHGLAREMYIRTLPFLKAHGFTALRSTFTSPGTRAIGAKLGFVEIGRVYFKDHKDENGEKVFPAAGDGEQEFATEIAYAL